MNLKTILKHIKLDKENFNDTDYPFPLKLLCSGKMVVFKSISRVEID